MEPTGAEKTSGRKRPPEWVIWLIGIAISLAVGLVFDHLTNETIIKRIELAQLGWIEAAKAATPFSVAQAYGTNLQEAAKSSVFWSPLLALASTAETIAKSGGFIGLLELALGALGVATYNHSKSKGRSIFFGDGITNILFGPVAIIAAASVVAAGLWLIMWLALLIFGDFITLASSLCGACGVAGFCSYCVRKIAEKNVEELLTPKFK